MTSPLARTLRPATNVPTTELTAGANSAHTSHLHNEAHNHANNDARNDVRNHASNEATKTVRQRSAPMLQVLRHDWSGSSGLVAEHDVSSSGFAEKMATAVAGNNKGLKLFVAQYGFMLDDQTLQNTALQLAGKAGSVHKISYVLGALRRMPSSSQLQELRRAAREDVATIEFISSLEKTLTLFSSMSQGGNDDQLSSLLTHYKDAVCDAHLTWICQHITANQWIRKEGAQWSGITAVSFIADLGDANLLEQAFHQKPLALEDLLRVRTEQGFARLCQKINFSKPAFSIYKKQLAIRAVMLDSATALDCIGYGDHSRSRNAGSGNMTGIPNQSPYHSPLHAAIAIGNSRMVSLLIAKGNVPTAFDLLQADHATPSIKGQVRRAFDAWDSKVDAVLN